MLRVRNAHRIFDQTIPNIRSLTITIISPRTLFITDGEGNNAVHLHLIRYRRFDGRSPGRDEAEVGQIFVEC